MAIQQGWDSEDCRSFKRTSLIYILIPKIQVMIFDLHEVVYTNKVMWMNTLRGIGNFRFLKVGQTQTIPSFFWSVFKKT